MKLSGKISYFSNTKGNWRNRKPRLQKSRKLQNKAKKQMRIDNQILNDIYLTINSLEMQILTPKAI